MAPKRQPTRSARPPIKPTKKGAKLSSKDESNPQQDLEITAKPDQLTQVAAESDDDTESQCVQTKADGSQSAELPNLGFQFPPVSSEPDSASAAANVVTTKPTSFSNVDTTAQSWLLLTNHHNMLYMLASGMIMGPAGFGGKHYSDPAGDVPGLIPVFRCNLPDAAVHRAVAEQTFLRPCIAKIDLTDVRGPVYQVDVNGNISSVMLPLKAGSDTIARLVPAPLPISIVTGLVFRSPSDRREFESSARSFANIDLQDLKIEVTESPFSSTSEAPWPLPDLPDATIGIANDKRPARGDAVGGMLAMLYHLANRSSVCLGSFCIASGTAASGEHEVARRDSVLAELGPWVNSGTVRADASVQARLFWGAVQALVDARREGSKANPVDVVIAFLEGKSSEMQGAGSQHRLERLIADMRRIFGLGGGTVSQLFERHKGTLSRPLLLFCLRRRCVDLLEFSHPDLGDEELVLAGVLFGVREGWAGLPVALRATDGLSLFVAQQMFEAEWGQRGDRLTLKSAASRPTTLRELVMRSDNARNLVSSEALVKMVGKAGWNDCLVSRVRLPPGQYRMHISPNGAEIVLRGRLAAPVIEVDNGALLKKIAQWPPLSLQHERELRSALSTQV